MSSVDTNGLFILLLLLNYFKCILVEVITTKQKETCEGGTSWLQDCNSCFCENDVIFCTTLDCTKVHGSLSSDVLMELHDPIRKVATSIEFFNDRKCENGSGWTKDCNWCYCTVDEKAALCTSKGCMGAFQYEAPKCIEGSLWKDNCNICECIRSTAVCTDVDCDSNDLLKSSLRETSHMVESTPVEPPPNVKCIEGSHWRKDCNWCNCIRGNDFCTQVACKEDTKTEEKQCTNGSQWLGDNCQWCTCKNGTAHCFAHKCPGEKGQVALQDNPIVDLVDAVCTRGSRWKKGCNWCNCISGIPLCNLAMCSNEAALAEDKKCVGNSQWRIDFCTWCHCEKGKGICTTTQRCMKSNDLIEVNYSCKDGNSWLKGCDFCTCSYGIAVCVKRSCSEMPSECTVEQNLNKGCNTCKCVDGITYCTRKTNCTEKRNLPPDLCSSPPLHPGTKACGDFSIKWSYSSEFGKCTKVIYGGCDATENLFNSEQSCQDVCQPDSARNLNPVVAISRTKSECTLPMKKGPCFASYKRYGFDEMTRQCKPFIYGGCLGNLNNFLTAKQCYDTCEGNPPIANFDCDRSQCKWQQFGHYLSKNCQPVYDGGSCCPVSFDCKNYGEGLSPYKCYYRNKEYSIGEEVPVQDECYIGCRCIESFVPGHLAEVRCAEVECPSLFERPQPGCRRLFRIGECCSYDQECLDPNLPPLSVREPNCKWNRRTWNIGDKMYFEDSPCSMCVCTPEFKNPTGPGCKQIECGFDFRYRSRFAMNCTPVYYENKCCPVSWLCPGRDPIKDLPSTGKSSGMHCIFGEKIIPIGTHVKSPNCKIDCHCQTPPELTCLMRRKCVTGREAETSSRTSCPEKCISEISHVTGQHHCICDKTKYTCTLLSCPGRCRDYVTFFNVHTGCKDCLCMIT